MAFIKQDIWDDNFGVNNDGARDWFIELESSNNDALIRKTIAKANETDAALPTELAQTVVAAAEILAVVRNNAVEQIPDDCIYTIPIKSWIRKFAQKPEDELLKATLSALEKAAGNSEWNDALAQSPESEQWEAYVGNLKTRLQQSN